MLQAEWPENKRSSPDKVTAFFLFPQQPGSLLRANKGSYAMCTTDSFIGNKAAGAWCRILTSIYCWG